MAALKTNQQGTAYAELGDVLRQNKPVPEEYASKTAYQHALHGWETARLVAEKKGGAPGLPDNDPELEQQAEKGLDLPPSAPKQGSGVIVNPAGLGDDRRLIIVIDHAANDPQ